MQLNEEWETYIKNYGADFIRFVDISSLSDEIKSEYSCAVFFGKVLSRKYIKARITGQKPEKQQEFGNTEHKMDNLSKRLADKLTTEGYKSDAGVKQLPHKTIARLAGFGFIGKNTLIVSEEYGCAVVFGKVLTSAPFEVIYKQPIKSQCGDCAACVDVCPSKALIGKTWSLGVKRDEMLIRKLCSTCLQCMFHCPYTVRYANG